MDAVEPVVTALVSRKRRGFERIAQTDAVLADLGLSGANHQDGFDVCSNRDQGTVLECTAYKILHSALSICERIKHCSMQTASRNKIGAGGLGNRNLGPF